MLELIYHFIVILILFVFENLIIAWFVASSYSVSVHRTGVDALDGGEYLRRSRVEPRPTFLHEERSSGWGTEEIARGHSDRPSLPSPTPKKS